MLVQHHEKYEEIHGEDKIVMMDYAEHRKLHTQLRKEGKCTIPREELHKIAQAAYRRTEKGKVVLERKEKKRSAIRDVPSRVISFSDIIDTNISFVERIRYNPNNGSATYFSYFKGCEGRKIIRVDI